MADAAINPVPVEGEEQFAEETRPKRFMDGFLMSCLVRGQFHDPLAFALLFLPSVWVSPCLLEYGRCPVSSKAPEPENKELGKFDKFDRWQTARRSKRRSWTSIPRSTGSEGPRIRITTTTRYSRTSAAPERQCGRRRRRRRAIGFGSGPK